MRARSVDLQRRHWFKAPLAALGGLFVARHAHAAEKASLIARPVEQVPADPGDAAWWRADTLEVPLAPQAVVKPRRYEASVKSLTVRALYTEKELAFLLEWRDPERNAMEGAAQAFRDAIAIEFPEDPTKGIPFFGMGEPERPVVIYQWRSDWEADGARQDVDEKYPRMIADWYPFSGRAAGEIAEAGDYGEKGDKVFLPSWWAGNPVGDPALQANRPVEKLGARGFGTLESLAPERQDATGKAVWKDGTWKALITIPRAQEKFAFERGKTLPVAFAAWNGAKHERGGEKGVSTWYFLSLEKPVSIAASLSPVPVVIGAFVAEFLALRWWRRRAGVAPRARPGGWWKRPRPGG